MIIFIYTIEILKNNIIKYSDTEYFDVLFSCITFQGCSFFRMKKYSVPEHFDVLFFLF